MTLVEEQLRAAHKLFDEAVRTHALGAHVVPEALGAQLLALGSSPTHDSLLAWARNFRGACIGATPLVAGQPMPLEGHLEIGASASALELELQGDFRGAVVALGSALVHQRRLIAEEVGELERGRAPNTEELRTVLGTWIQRGAAWGGPILGWMRDMRDRLEACL